MSCRFPCRALIGGALGLLMRRQPAAAHGPTRQKVTEQITIDAPAAAVWARIRNFDALKDWHPAVVDEPGRQGQRRRLGAPARSSRAAAR